MRQFIKEALSERGEPSIKRLTLVVLLLAFLAECAVNLSGKQRMMIDPLRDQLFDLVIIAISTVFGINIANVVKDVQIERSKNNKAVGSPSPAPDTTIITPEKPTT
jgi:hypothetical protein